MCPLKAGGQVLVGKQGEVFPDRKHPSLGMEVVLRRCLDAPGGDAQCCVLYGLKFCYGGVGSV